MCGLSGSGKSTIATRLAKDNPNTVIVSSDAIREELTGNYEDQEHNEEVFKIFHDRIRKNLENKKNVIADATNITMKSRRAIMQKINGLDVYKVCYIIPKPFEQCKIDNKNREHPVPDEVLDKQIRRFQIPFYEEKWDEIVFYNCNIEEYNKRKRLSLNTRMMRFNQNNPYHKYNLYDHSKALAIQYKDEVMKEVGFLHDCMKFECETLEDDNISHFYNHENLSSYFVLSNPSITTISQKEDFLNLLFFINYHMLPFQKLNKEKWTKRFGDKKYNILMDLHKKDILAANECIFNKGKNNLYISMGEYYIGYTRNGDSFKIDTEDLYKVIDKGFVIKDRTNNDNRLISMTNNKFYYLHRLIMDIDNPKIVVDHINHDQTDNRKRNLRLCSSVQNSYNTSTSKNNTSGHNGVSRMKNGKYRAYINNNRKQICLGTFNTLEEAVVKRTEAEIKLYGQYSPYISKIISK